MVEKEVWEKTIALNKGTFGMDAADWQARGFYKPDEDLSKLEDYIAYETFLKNPGNSHITAAKGESTKQFNRTKSAFKTLSGRVEAYCLPMMENYEMRMGDNIDTSVTLPNNGSLYTKLARARISENAENKGRYCYPVPMYIPLIEGCHASTEAEYAHPDPLGLYDQGYNCNLLTWHTIYRSHSTFNSSAFINEVEFYKRDKDGNPTHIRRSLTNANAGANIDNLDTIDTSAPQVWTDNVYETIWLNPETAAAKGIAEGDVIIVESLRGKIAGSAHLSERVRPGTISMTQGSWYAPIENWKSPYGTTYDKVDVGGNANTLFGLRPCRIAGGMSLASECRVKVYKADKVQ